MAESLNELSLPDLLDALVPADQFAALLQTALREDMGVDRQDVTSDALLAADRSARGEFCSRQKGVLAGAALLERIAGEFDSSLSVNVGQSDGASLAENEPFGSIEGPLGRMLGAERTMLNFLTHLSGIATLSRAYVDAVAGTAAQIYDTRKTTPGLRGLEKYAVRCGGASNHRIGLYDAVLIKDNHLVGRDLSSLAGPIADVRRAGSLSFVEIEVDTLDQLGIVLDLDVDIVLLDNMEVADLVQAVAMRNAQKLEVQLEASGGVSLKTVQAIAQTGVDRIAVGALTHSAPALDIGLDVQ
jgi:nicotinate-nucleotide pyrophosphorylase (carboxylating)